VGLNFDLGHFFCVGEDPSEAFQNLFSWIEHIHLEDIAGRRRHYHLIPGQGGIDFPRILRTIIQSGYSGDISLELYTYADRPVDAGQESLNYLLPKFREAGFEVDALLGPAG
jgi:sugar phosphate isomerase/epimerase